jgi:hypothetical protein
MVGTEVGVTVGTFVGTLVAVLNHLVAPVVNYNPLTTPSHIRYLLPTEKIERLSKKPTRAQVVQITTNLRHESCHYLPIDVVLPENYDSFETLLMLQYVMNPSKMEECTHWKHWDREKFCQELLSAVPDNSVVRPDSATTASHSCFSSSIWQIQLWKKHSINSYKLLIAGSQILLLSSI